MLKNVSRSTFYEAFLEIGYLKYYEFVGLYEPSSDWECYLSDDKLSGFAITKEKELVNLFNANPNYKLLSDPEVVEFINSNVDWIVCLGYYNYKEVDAVKFTVEPTSLVDYYKSKLDFDVFGTTESDTGDMIDSIGLGHTAAFVKKYGIPFQTFLLNRKYPILNDGRYGRDGYEAAKKNILMYIDMHSED